MSRPATRALLRAPGLALALVVASALASAPARAAGAEDSFREGMSALDQNKWGVASAAFRAAIAERPEEGGRRVRIYGTWLLDYLPHYYLGVALFQLDDLEGAAAEWRESRRQGAILATPLVADLERWESRLRREARDAGPEKAAAAPPPPAPAAGAAPREEAELAPVAPEAVADSPAASPPAGSGSAGSPAPSPAPAPDGRESAPPAAPVEVSAPERVAPAAPPDGRQLLLAAARLYFDGHYQETLAELAAARWPGRAPARACLLESASALALHRQAGGSDERYLERARAALAGCPALSRRDRPDPRLFSPAFTQLFDETLAARGAPAPARGEETP